LLGPNRLATCCKSKNSRWLAIVKEIIEGALAINIYIAINRIYLLIQVVFGELICLRSEDIDRSAAHDLSALLPWYFV